MPIDLLAELANPANPAKAQTGQGATDANHLLTAAKPTTKLPSPSGRGAGGEGQLAKVSARLAAGNAPADKALSGISKVSGQPVPDYITHPERYEFPSFTIPTAAGTFSFQMAVLKGKYDAFAILAMCQRHYGSCSENAISCPASGPAP